MPSTASQLERSLRKIQISDSKATSNSEQWVPAKRSLGRPQDVLARPPRAAGGYRQFFGFPVTMKDVGDLGTIAFNHIRPGEKADRWFMTMNAPAFIEQSLRLPFCTVARGQVVGEAMNIAPECVEVASSSVLLLVVWRDTDDDEDCPTLGQVRALEKKIQRSPGWWVEHREWS